MGPSRWSPPLLFALAALGTACEQEYHYHEWDYVDIFYQNPVESVDILMVVDNSGSMQPYQEELGQNFSQFISYFIEADIDYQIATTTTDTAADDAGQILGQIITSSTPDAEAVFAEIVSVGVMGSGFEMGLEAAQLALTDPLINSTNAGFLRDEASLSLIFVSDEEDSSPDPVNNYINAFREIKGQRERDVFNASALVVTDESACDDPDGWSTYGERYIDVAHQTNGVMGNICAESFDAIVTELSLNASRLREAFYLSAIPDVSSLQVSVDETEKPCEEGEWSFQVVTDEYGVEQHAVVFLDEYMPPTNSQIAVRYYAGSGDPEDFCPASGESEQE